MQVALHGSLPGDSKQRWRRRTWSGAVLLLHLPLLACGSIASPPFASLLPVSLLLASALTAAPARAAVVDYLYVESNEGSSSGGHVALRLDNRTYDFQHHDPGVVRLDRRDAGDFLYSYAFLQNRPVHVSRLAVSGETAALLRDRFNSLYLAERAQFLALDVLAEDRRLLAALAGLGGADTDSVDEDAGAGDDSVRRDAGAAPTTIAIRGAGYFFNDTQPAAAVGTAVRGQRSASSDPRAPARSTPALPPDSSPALVRLRAKVEQRLGPGSIATRIDAERDALAALEPRVVTPAELTTEAGSYPHVHAAFSARYSDAVTALASLEVLRTAAAVREEATATGADAAFELTAERTATLRRFEARLAGDLVELLSSRRPDWGLAMLVGMARLDVLDRSLRRGRLVILDAFPSDTQVLPFAAVRDSRALPELIADARTDAESSMATLVSMPLPVQAADTAAHSNSERSDGVDEASWNHVESSLNRLHELLAAETRQSDVRLADDRLSPERIAALPVDVIPKVAATTFARLADEAAAVERSYADELHHRFAYDLVGRNCVSELLGTMDDALGGQPWATAGHLGGWIDDNSAARVIPFLSADAVNRHYRIESRHELPSWREQRLAAMASGDDGDRHTTERDIAERGKHRARGIAVALREATTLTSQIYRPTPDDSFFVLFADHVVSRPLAGVVNLTAAAGATTVALATLPIRGFEPLRAGLRGMLYSAPELAFVRIRRGSFVYVERKAARLPAWW